jgi:hypothetical protein
MKELIQLLLKIDNPEVKEIADKMLVELASMDERRHKLCMIALDNMKRSSQSHQGLKELNTLIKRC